jgi:cell envelope opacity-associated protein A
MLPASSCIAASVASSVVGARVVTTRSTGTSTTSVIKVAPVVRCQAVAKGDENPVVDRRAVMVAAAASVLAIAAPVFAAEEVKPKKSSKYGEYGNICAALPTGSKCHQS